VALVHPAMAVVSLVGTVIVPVTAMFGVLVLLMGHFTLCGRLRPFPQQLLFYPLLIRLRDRFIVLAVSVLVTAIVLLIFLS